MLPRKLLLSVFAVLKSAAFVGAVGRVVPLLNGWHFDNLQRDSMGFEGMSPPALIVLWSSDWSINPKQFGIEGGRGLPSRAHLFLGDYDVERRKDVWWNISSSLGEASGESDPRNNVLPGPGESLFLDRRFKFTHAPSLVFLPDSRSSRHEVWLGELAGQPADWRAWVWEKLSYDVRVDNRLGVPCVVRVVATDQKAGGAWDDAANGGANGGAARGVALGLFESASITVLPSYRLEAVDPESSETILWASEPLLRDDESTCGAISIGEGGEGFAAVSSRATAAEVKRRDLLLNARDQDTTFTHAAILRQPPVMPAHDHTSAYSLAAMPPELHARLWAFYQSRAPQRTDEEYREESTGINQHAAMTTLVSLDLDFGEKEGIARMVQPLVEEWAGMPLVFTSFYGIREYYRGAELRMHVDRVATHVFSVIINLHQEGTGEETGGEDWPLDLIEFDGTSSSVVMKPGEILFYQSAKLIHGRPKPFNGSIFANAFCHFKPAEGWDFEYGAGDVLYFKGEPFVDYKVD